MRRVSNEELADLRRDAIFTRDRIGAPGCAVRRRAEALIRLLDDYENEICLRIKAEEQLRKKEGVHGPGCTCDPMWAAEPCTLLEGEGV